MTAVAERHARRTRRTTVLTGVALAAGLAAGLLAGPGPAQARDGTSPLAYRCQVLGRTHEVAVRVTGAFPETAVPGRPITPGDPAVRVALPPEAVAGLLPEGTASVSATLRMTTLVAHNGRTAEASWDRLTAPAAAPGPGGGLALEHTGPVPAVTVTGPGDVAFRAGDIRLELHPETADGAEPLTLPPVECTPAEDRDTLLATVRALHPPTRPPSPPDTGPAAPPSDTGPDTGPDTVPGPGAPSGGREGAARAEPPAADTCPEAPPTGGFDESFVPEPTPGEPPRVIDLPGRHGCAYVVGLANVRKLGGAMIVNDPARNPQKINAMAVKRTVVRPGTRPGGNYFRADSFGEITLPDAESTFLAFGFQPVSARVEFTNGPLTITTGTIGSPPDRVNFAMAGFYQSLRIHDVTVNGTPLDVGPVCRTARPFRVVLHGEFPHYQNVLFGGPMRGTVTIPEFEGCGTPGEDLDPLFSAALSGPGNLVAMNQGPLCVPVSQLSCPPDVPVLPGREEGD
ncbi:DUF6801 domain-containing protein [Streptomyces sp. C10-9-1]|uniref:DUF6801 domain-containing protein n=1 Tax=Streptomyces sp. C10-9-1 TaxID=1859285 RepID=UPI003F4A075A